MHEREGERVWVRITGYPWWPACVCANDEGQIEKTKVAKGGVETKQLHVKFYDDPPTFGWTEDKPNKLRGFEMALPELKDSVAAKHKLHDRFQKAYWVNIHVAESLLTAGPDAKPRLEVKADREANRVTVDAIGIERFELLLNDDLVDLDKEFTVVVNGKAKVEKRTRSFMDLKDRVVRRNDWDYLFPVKYVTTVAKE